MQYMLAGKCWNKSGIIFMAPDLDILYMYCYFFYPDNKACE